MMKIIVNINKSNYPIYIGKNLFNKRNVFIESINTNRTVIITNKSIAEFYLNKISYTIKSVGIGVDSIIIPDGEKYKTLLTMNNIFTLMIKKKHDRNTTLIALGGGVIGDLTSFSAAIYQRGIQFIQAPTSLLSQVDSSIGGKSAVNHSSIKNMIGVFYQPTSVLIDLNCLKTLPKREFFSGFAEVIKYAIAIDKFFFRWLENNIDSLLKLDFKLITYCVQHCCKLKKRIISVDEKEKGSLRVLLNLGHTFAHAIESYMGYGEWLHGESVSVGIVMAAKTAELIGELNQKNTKRIINLLKRANLKVKGPSKMKANDYISRMIYDKKTIDGKINLILPTKIGLSKIYKNVNQQTIIKAITSCL
ncbi:3-dehydroquinate synthase [Candidatus Providencia siddallii]|uniref:3-dehydroquinate synthase n=1 Tax=Candidatus Providencia siddallii TaxID=1715285 RepID=A0A0M6W978_9GAMM|nr:3-dehydroquinate synthase [Candidatus Providencia siddallii]